MPRETWCIFSPVTHPNNKKIGKAKEIPKAGRADGVFDIFGHFATRTKEGKRVETHEHNGEFKEPW
jgi:hypothetical protein